MRKKTKKIFVVGHRGCAGLLPENTLAGFKHAFEMDVDAVECDVHSTKDGHIVIYHDYHINPFITRNNDDSWVEELGLPLSKRNLAEIRQYKLGKIKPNTSYMLSHPEVKNCADEFIPVIDELFDLAKEYPNIQLQIEIKTRSDQPQISSDPEKLVNLVIKKINQYGFQNRAVILSFDWRCLLIAKKLDPDIPLSFIYGKGIAGYSPELPWFKEYNLEKYNNSIPAMVAALGGNTCSVLYNEFTIVDVKEAHKYKLMFNAWTPNVKKDLTNTIAKDVDSITTDRPDVLLDMLNK